MPLRLNLPFSVSQASICIGKSPSSRPDSFDHAHSWSLHQFEIPGKCLLSSDVSFVTQLLILCFLYYILAHLQCFLLTFLPFIDLICCNLSIHALLKGGQQLQCGFPIRIDFPSLREDFLQIFGPASARPCQPRWHDRLTATH